jgi:xylose isomerase-like TIM barrel protein
MIVPGLVSVTFRQLSVDEVVDVAVANGLRAIEWGGDVHVPAGDLAAAARTARRCAAAGIAVAAYGSYYRAGVFGDFGPVLDTATTLGAPRIRVWAGHAGSAATPADRRAAVVADLRRVTELAAERGVEIAVEYHARTLTDTLESTVDLFAAVGHGSMRPYWQPPIGESDADCLMEVAALLPALVTTHVFSWDDDGTRLPLAAREPLWRQVFGWLRQQQGERYALLEFVRDDDPTALAEDASTLHALLE